MGPFLWHPPCIKVGMENINQPTSVRKTYLTRRAHVIREVFKNHDSNFNGFVSEVRSQQFNATKDEMLFASCLQWMQQELHTEAKISTLAKLFGVSVRKIQRLFVFFLEDSYTAILLNMRLTAAKGYLKNTGHTVGQVGLLVGIKDHAYFTYLFRKTFDITPSEFRTNNQDDKKNSTNLS